MTHPTAISSASACRTRLFAFSCALAVLAPFVASAAVVSGTYTGNGSSQTITLGFQPNVVIVKDQIATGLSSPAQIRTSAMSFTKTFGQLSSGSTSTTRITSLSSTGFSVGSDTAVNSSGITYNYFAFNAVAGESAVGTYTGNGTDDRNIAGLGFQPDFVLAMDAAGTTSTWRSSAMSGDLSLTWDTSSGTDRIQAFNSDGFQIGTHSFVNTNGTTYYYVAAKNVSGKFKAGTYTGDGVARSITGLGFQPEAVLLKRDGTTTGAFKFASTGNSTDLTLVFNSSTYATNRITGLEADGFSIGTGGNSINGSGFSYYYVAWKRVAAATNTAPTISNVANQATTTGVATSALAVTLGDTETAVASLTLTGSSSNTTLVPNANLVFGGSGANRTVTVTPAAGQNGTATLTLTVTDGGSLTATDTFVLTVSAPADTTAPTISSIVRQTPTGQSLTAGTTTATFRVTFSEAVNTPATSNFAVTAVNSSSIVGTIASVTAISTSIYDVAVTLSSGTGEFRLKVVD